MSDEPYGHHGTYIDRPMKFRKRAFTIEESDTAVNGMIDLLMGEHQRQAENG